MVNSMRANGMNKEGKTVREFKSWKTVVFMKGFGKQTKGTEGDFWLMPMIQCTMENGKMTSSMGTESITTRMVISMKDSGSKASIMEMEKWLGLKVIVMKVSTVMVRGTGKVNSLMLTDRCCMLVISLKILNTVMVSKKMKTVVNMMGSGRATIWVAKESKPGLTVVNMREST